MSLRTRSQKVQEALLFGKRDHQERPSLEERWGERKLFFWTARQSLWLILLAAATVYVVVSLAAGGDTIPLRLVLPK